MRGASRSGARLAALSATVVAWLLATAPVAVASEGEGLWGPIDDRVITFFAFGVIAFFAILVTVLTLVQIRLENRKERRRHDLERLGN